MLNRVYPVALGRDQSEKELHLWDPESDLNNQEFEGSSIKGDCRWGAGLVDDETALILYIFHGERTIEVYFPQKIAVGPNREMNSWDVLLAIKPESLVLVYGEQPTDRDRWLQVQFEQDTTLLSSLEEFIEQTLKLHREGSDDPVVTEISQYFLNLEQSNPA